MAAGPEEILTHSLEIGERVYAFGLVWYAAEGIAPRRLKRHARRYAADRGFDLFVVSGAEGQFGAGRTHEDFIAGSVSAASALTEAVGQSVLGMFLLQGGRWWVYSATDGVIDGDGDLVFEHEEEALRQVESLQGINAYDLIFAPTHVGIAGAVEKPLSDLLEDTAGAVVRRLESPLGDEWASLREYARRQWRFLPAARARPAALGALALAAGGLAYWLAGDGETEEVFEDIGEVVPVEAEIEKVVRRPYAMEPSAPAFAQQCMDALRRLIVATPGWSFARAACTSGVANLALRRAAQGREGMLRTTYAGDKGDKALTLRMDKDRQGAVVTLDELRGARPQGPRMLSDFQSAKSGLINVAERLGLVLRLEDIRSEPAEEADPEEPARRFVNLPEASFEIETMLRPGFWSLVLDAPGVVIERAEWSADSGWMIKGRVYAESGDFDGGADSGDDGSPEGARPGGVTVRDAGGSGGPPDVLSGDDGLGNTAGGVGGGQSPATAGPGTGG